MSPKPTESHTASPKLNHHQAPSSSRSIFAKLKAAKQRCMSAAKMFGVSENAMKTIFLQLKPWINVLILKENVSNPPWNLWTFQLQIRMVWFLGPLMLKHAKIQLFIFFWNFHAPEEGWLAPGEVSFEFMWAKYNESMQNPPRAKYNESMQNHPRKLALQLKNHILRRHLLCAGVNMWQQSWKIYCLFSFRPFSISKLILRCSTPQRSSKGRTCGIRSHDDDTACAICVWPAQPSKFWRWLCGSHPSNLW